MLLNLAMASLICALMAGVFGFEGTPSTLPAAVFWARVMFVPFLGIAVIALMGGMGGLDRRWKGRHRSTTATNCHDHVGHVLSSHSGTSL